jgi:hypothetical protein
MKRIPFDVLIALLVALGILTTGLAEPLHIFIACYAVICAYVIFKTFFDE